MARVTYISASKSEIVGSEFTLQPSESRRFYSRPQLLTGEFVKAQGRSESGFNSLGILINQGDDSGLLTNETTQPRAFKLIKSATTKNIEIQYDD